MQIKWLRLPNKESHSHVHIKTGDICIYAREYKSEGYIVSETNSLISNFKKSPKNFLFVFDDVLTSGAHFRAMSDFLKENKYKGPIVGIFWARAISTE